MNLEDVYNIVSKTETAEIVSTKNISGNEPLKKYNQVISIETELSLNEGLRIIRLYIAFKEPNSVYLPKIYIDEESYDSLKHIPHVNNDFSICVVDENENYVFEINDLPKLTLKLISSAKRILRDKDKLEYVKEEFEREFLAYWDINYGKSNFNQIIGLSLIDYKKFENIRGIKIYPKFGQYKYLIYNDEDHFRLFQRYVELNGAKCSEVSVFVAEYENVFPPYNISLNDSLSYLINNNDFRIKINNLSNDDVLVIFRGNQNEIFGWMYPFLNKKANGFRSMSNWQYLASGLSKSEHVRRISFSNIMPDRLDKRTTGFELERNLEITIIGLGSVGSNLLHFLIKFPISKYCLIDPDVLKVENIYRNKFGFNSISNFKTKIAEFEILSKNPFTEVVTDEQDICKILEDNPFFIEGSDYRIVVLGITRIEKYILNHLIKIKSEKPIILIWVEPYLASGQLVYVKPEDFQQGLSLISNFPYHVLEKGQDFLKKEGSCQTGYMPYSDLNVNLFLSSINMFLQELMVLNKKMKSKVLTWVGDLKFIENNEIKISQNYSVDDSYKLLENEF